MSGFTPDFSPSGTGSRAGAVPDPGTTAGASRYLREDATWVVPGSIPPGPTPPAPGPALNQWACNLAGFLTYEVLRSATKFAVDAIPATWIGDVVGGIVVGVITVLLPEDIFLDGTINTIIHTWVTAHVQTFLTDFGTYLLDDVVWAKFHCQIYDAILATPGNLATAMNVAGTAIAALIGYPTGFLNGIEYLLQHLGITSIVGVPLSAFSKQYDCSTCVSTGIGPTNPLLQEKFDLIVSDGTNRETFVDEIDFVGATVTAVGPVVTVTLPDELTVTDGITSVTEVDTIQFNHSVVAGTTGTATVTPEIGVQHNGSSVGVEPLLDLIDSLSVDWTVTDDVPGTRVLVSGTVPKATSSSLGIVQPDNVSTVVDGSGKMSALVSAGYPLWYQSVEPPAAGSWTQVNCAGLTVANSPGGPSIDGVIPQGQLALLVRAVSTPYILMAGFVGMLAMTPSGGQPGFGIVLRDSATGHLVVWRFLLNGGTATLAVSTFSSPTVGVANNFINTSYTSMFVNSAPPLWLFLANDGVNRTYGISRDGKNTLNLYSEAAGTYITEDQAGFCLEGTGFSVADGVTLISWTGP